MRPAPLPGVACGLLWQRVMAVTSISSALLPSPRLPTVAPRLLQNVVGGILELVIHAVEDWRDRRRGAH